MKMTVHGSVPDIFPKTVKTRKRHKYYETTTVCIGIKVIIKPKFVAYVGI